jgi:hypothetical protein
MPGSVAEWSKALVLGTSLNEAWVRIPPLPVVLLFKFKIYLDEINHPKTLKGSRQASSTHGGPSNQLLC